MSDDDLPDFSIPPGMKLPGPSDPIGDWSQAKINMKLMQAEIAAAFKDSREQSRREWQSHLRDSASPN